MQLWASAGYAPIYTGDCSIDLPEEPTPATHCYSWMEFSCPKLDVTLPYISGIAFNFKPDAEGAKFNLVALGTNKKKVSEYNTYMSIRENQTTAWDYMNPSIDYDTIIDSRDGKPYRIVTIGDQTWMAENLNYETATSACQENNPRNCDIYGRLYAWREAQSVCPSGWKLPSWTDYRDLSEYVGGNAAAKLKLKTTFGWLDDYNGTDDVGFSALPGGRLTGYSTQVDWFRLGAFFQTSDSYSDGDKCYASLRQDNNFETGGCVKDSTEKRSVRCLLSPNSGLLKDTRDGQVYRTIKIGTQTWMADNLNYDYPYPTAGNGHATSSFCFGDDSTNCNRKRGRLYTWSAAMDSAGRIPGNTANNCGDGVTCSVSEPVRGVCPVGWHLPSKTEFLTLLDYVGGTSTAGTKLKTSTGWQASSGIPNGTDDYAFSAQPGGYYYAGGGTYLGINAFATYWGSTGNGTDNVWIMSIGYNREAADTYSHPKANGNSVRCVKNSD